MVATRGGVLGDCWRMDLGQQPRSWVRCPHLELGPRGFHASVALDHQVMVTGGVTNRTSPHWTFPEQVNSDSFVNVSLWHCIRTCS